MNKPTKNFTVIFDLDDTVVNTKHRYRNKPCGNIDLDYWFANSTPEMIAKDTLLPLAAIWRRYYAEGYEIVVCTARSWERHPLMNCEPGPIYERFLADNGLRYHALLHRVLVGPEHETMGDGDLKTRLLNDWAAREGKPENWRERAVMYDDNRKVIEKMLADKLHCKDAVKQNAYLSILGIAA
jgi:hypothetical protein